VKKKAIIFVWLILLLGSTGTLAQAGSVRVYFSPRGGCTDAIISQINRAKSEILIQAYSFTSQAIARSLIQAKRRGVKIIAVLDRTTRTRK